jgi:hypothetical protein
MILEKVTIATRFELLCLVVVECSPVLGSIPNLFVLGVAQPGFCTGRTCSHDWPVRLTTTTPNTSLASLALKWTGLDFRALIQVTRPCQ